MGRPPARSRSARPFNSSIRMPITAPIPRSWPSRTGSIAGQIASRSRSGLRRPRSKTSSTGASVKRTRPQHAGAPSFPVHVAPIRLRRMVAIAGHNRPRAGNPFRFTLGCRPGGNWVLDGPASLALGLCSRGGGASRRWRTAMAIAEPGPARRASSSAAVRRQALRSLWVRWERAPPAK